MSFDEDGLSTDILIEERVSAYLMVELEYVFSSGRSVAVLMKWVFFAVDDQGVQHRYTSARTQTHR